MNKKIQIGVRILLGLLFLLSGIAFFFVTPPPASGDMETFFNGLMATRYFLPLLKGTEILCGLFLVLGIFVPLALVILAPIVLHIFMIHALLDPGGLPVAILIGLALSYLSFFSPDYGPVIRKLFARKI